eukprot:CAMPEP_0206138952 /NCGR_PEP_ID=MMETSP1473-20131121/4017_1 /ASSEMBLY_ACC=CAM_ASM_001109 /TAXON_ID=1461547 /ORGANISM="Stichococcus sp, Strain RCC1054" /LENGTH=123 /DNA_ID=CAMNT_0053532525 /DNA_START=340 /DNA_END=708 /DNA_ORIENTATION=+
MRRFQSFGAAGLLLLMLVLGVFLHRSNRGQHLPSSASASYGADASAGKIQHSRLAQRVLLFAKTLPSCEEEDAAVAARLAILESTDALRNWPYRWPPPAASEEDQRAFEERLQFTHQPKADDP